MDSKSSFSESENLWTGEKMFRKITPNDVSDIKWAVSV